MFPKRGCPQHTCHIGPLCLIKLEYTFEFEIKTNAQKVTSFIDFSGFETSQIVIYPSAAPVANRLP